MKPEVVVIDYGVGNLLSVQRGLEHCNATVVLSSDPEVIANAGKLVLPGVGAFANAMAALHERGLVEPIRVAARKGTPLLGICLGMQLLLDESDEFGLTPGLSLVPGRVIAIPPLAVDGNAQKIPHIGWNALHAANSWENTALADVKTGEAVYFVHSFQAMPAAPSDLLATCTYGGAEVPAVIRRDNVTGCQFHPEKSGRTGLKILARFCDY